MRCPVCRSEAEPRNVRFSQLGPDNQLVPVNEALLTCGCRIPYKSVQEAQAAQNWERRAQQRRDDNLRSVFG